MNSQTGSKWYESVFLDTRRKCAGNLQAFKDLQRCSGENQPYPSDGETAAICSVKGLEWAVSPSCGLFLASFCGFNAIVDPVYEFMA